MPIITMEKKDYDQGMILIKDGKIQKVGENFEIPEGYNPMMMIVIGKAKESVRERYYRRPFADIVHKDRF